MKLTFVQSLFFLMVAFGMAGGAGAQSTYLLEYNTFPLLFPDLLVSAEDGSVVSFGTTIDQQKTLGYFLKTDRNGGFVGGKRYSVDGTRLALKAAIHTSDGGYLLSAFNGLELPGGELFVIKLNAQGTPEWKKRFDYEDIQAVVEVADGFLLSGSGRVPDSNFARIILMKLDAKGNLKWKEGMSSPAPQTGIGAFAIHPVAGGAVLGSVFFENNNNLLVLTKVNSGGKIVWSRKYDAERDYLFGGAGSLSVNPSGDILVTAVMTKGWENKAPNGIAILKTDSSGKLLWANFHSSPPGDLNLRDSKPLADGGVSIVGALWPPRTNQGSSTIAPWHAFAAKVNPDGAWVWKRLFAKYDQSELNALAALPDGTVAAVGNGTTIAISARLSPQGQIDQSCDKFHSFAVSSKKIKIASEAVSLQTSALPLSTKNLSMSAESFQETGLAVCSGH